MKLKDDLQEQLDGILLDGLPDLVNPADLARRVSAPSYSPKGLAIAVGRWLAMIGARPHNRLTKSRKTALTLWSLRDHDHFRSLGPTERLRLYREQGPLTEDQTVGRQNTQELQEPVDGR